VIDWLREGKLKADGLITHRFPLAAYKEAIATAQDKTGRQAIKIVFDYCQAG
jgi:L-iditol 2-dehydrogenase